MTETSAARDWHYGDEPCTYSGGCNEPLRSHTHLSPGPGQPTVVVYYDDPAYEWGRFGPVPKTPNLRGRGA